MKINLTYLFLFLFCMSYINPSFATHTWLGNSAAWDDPNQWDMGSVPTVNDDVIIPSGTARLYNGDNGFAKSIHVQTGAYLRLYYGSEMEITGAVNTDGLLNDGQVHIYGELLISNVTKTANNYSAKGIKNNNWMHVYINGHIIIKTIEEDAFYNGPSSYCYNSGVMDLYDLGANGITNFDRFLNARRINITANDSSPNYGIENLDDFRNYASGVINITGGGDAGVRNMGSSSTTAHFKNYGDIEINYSSDAGFSNSEIVTNYFGGLIEVEHSASTNITNSVSGVINNHGLLYSRNSLADGFSNRGAIYNYSGMNDYFSNRYSYVGYNTSYLFVDHNTQFGADYGIDIFLSGNIDISPSGFLTTKNRIFIFGGDLINEGMYTSYDEGSNHYIGFGGVFENHGAIEDRHGRVPTNNIDNQQVILAPITGTMQVGVPYPNVLDVASLDNVTIDEEWTDGPGTNATVLGTYNQATNEFTPNSNAIGVDFFRVGVEINASGDSRLMTINLDNPVIPFTGDNTSQFNIQSTSGNSIALASLHKLEVYPNPTSGFVQLKSMAFENGTTNIEVVNMLGQVVLSQTVGARDQRHSMNLPTTINDGVYYIRLLQDGKQTGTQRIQLQRN